jgi:hypothetical protein
MATLLNYGNLEVETIFDNAALTSAYSASNPINVQGANIVEIYSSYTKAGSATSIKFKFETSVDSTVYCQETTVIATAPMTVVNKPRTHTIASTHASRITIDPIATKWLKISARTLGGSATQYLCNVAKVHI